MHTNYAALHYGPQLGGREPGDGGSSRGAAVRKSVFARFIMSFDEDLCLFGPAFIH